MAKTLKYVNEEFVKVWNDSEGTHCNKSDAFYFFIQGFNNGLNYEEEDDGKE